MLDWIYYIPLNYSYTQLNVFVYSFKNSQLNMNEKLDKIIVYNIIKHKI